MFNSAGANPDFFSSESIETVEEVLIHHGQLGVVSITVLQRGGRCIEDGWEDYDATLEAISAFLTDYLRRSMRSSDRLLDPIVAGNTFVLFVSPPRQDRALDLIDLSRVRIRLSRHLRRHLCNTVTPKAIEKFGVYVGGALVRHDPKVPGKHAIARSIDFAFADGLNQRSGEARVNTSNLKRVLHNGQLRSVFQPVVDLVDQRIIGFEALTRVNPAHFPTPDLLFKAAHQNGALWELERLTRRCALSSAPTLRDDQLLFLNIEPDSIHDPDLGGANFLNAIHDAGIEPDQIVFEITERAVVQDIAAFREMLGKHRSRGFRLALDDVGSGYAGLHTIAELCPEYLKIDMALVRDLHRHRIKRELISTIHSFARRMGITLVAEGVEQLQELRVLTEMGVRCAQGFLFSHPSEVPGTPDWQSLSERETVAS